MPNFGKLSANLKRDLASGMGAGIRWPPARPG